MSRGGYRSSIDAFSRCHVPGPEVAQHGPADLLADDPPSHHGNRSRSSQQNSVRVVADGAETEVGVAGDRAAVLDPHQLTGGSHRVTTKWSVVKQRTDPREALELGADAHCAARSRT